MNDLFTLMRCPECGNEDIDFNDAQTTCNSCKKVFYVDKENKLIDFAPEFIKNISQYDVDKVLEPRDKKKFDLIYQKVQNIWNRFNIDKSSLVLDVGGYDGKMSKSFANSVVLDISRAALKHATNKNNIKLAMISDMHTIPFKDSSFDFVILSSVLEHTYDTKLFLGEMSRVLKSDGLAFVIVPNAKSIMQIWKLLKYGEVKPTGNRPYDEPEHQFFFTKENVKQLFSLESNNFELIFMDGDFLSLPFFSNRNVFYSMLLKQASYKDGNFSDNLMFMIKNKK